MEELNLMGQPGALGYACMASRFLKQKHASQRPSAYPDFDRYMLAAAVVSHDQSAACAAAESVC